MLISFSMCHYKNLYAHNVNWQHLDSLRECSENITDPGRGEGLPDFNKY